MTTIHVDKKKHGEFDRCPTCGKYDWLKTHKCPPHWCCKEDWHDDDEWGDVYANSADEAAEKYSENYDDDVPEDRKHNRTVMVRPFGGDIGAAQTFEVDMEYVPSYHAREIKGEKK